MTNGHDLLPRLWHVFGPVPRRHTPPSLGQLTDVPRILEIDGHRVSPSKATSTNGRLDMGPFIGGTLEGKTAYVYIPFTVRRKTRTVLALGADWWFEAFLDGRPFMDTLATGNGRPPPGSALNKFHKAVSLSKGKHCLAIRFVSGSGGSLLYAGCVNKAPAVVAAPKADGPASPLFRPCRLAGADAVSPGEADRLVGRTTSSLLRQYHGSCVAWGLPFEVGKIIATREKPATIPMRNLKARWLVFFHFSEDEPLKYRKDGFLASPSQGAGRLGKLAARYVLTYSDGSEAIRPIRQRFEIGMNVEEEAGLGCVPRSKPKAVPPHHERPDIPMGWGVSQGRVSFRNSMPPWVHAWENPHPSRKIRSVRVEPVSGVIIVLGITAGNVESNPLRWESRRKAFLALSHEESRNLLEKAEMDLGTIISIRPAPRYDAKSWTDVSRGIVPPSGTAGVVVEYTAHPDAAFHLPDGAIVPVKSLGKNVGRHKIETVPAAAQFVTLRIVDRQSRKNVPVRLHIHGTHGEYLAPTDRHRIPNPAWFEDYGADLAKGLHYSAYVPGETSVFLPVGKVFVEVTKGFEIKPVRKVISIGPDTKTVTIEIEKVLPWREHGWVTADTHVHFISPATARLEGEAEGVNVVNILASQWGELMTSVGDFDGKTTFGSREAGGTGEYLVRVGSENRQGILGHISLIGYEGGLITPMTTGGPDESALGDPVWSTLTEWAEQCRRKKGVVVIPHFPFPRSENAAAIVSGNVHAVEMTFGISPYALSDWYRYLNCGHMVGAVGGTDKMSASTAIGQIRTYAYVGADRPFTYDAWKEAVRGARTFVTVGPLLKFTVEGKPVGSRLRMSRSGGTVCVEWEAASVTIPMARVDLVRNGEIIETAAVKKNAGRGSWKVHVGESSWLALLARDADDLIVAHSSPVMIDVAGSPFFSAADAVTILEQIEGALAYIETLGTRAEARRFKAMKLKLTSVHRELHNRMHRAGHFHHHVAPADPKHRHDELPAERRWNIKGRSLPAVPDGKLGG